MEENGLSAVFSRGASKRHTHSHDFHQIICVTAGRAEVSVGDRHYPVKRGSAVFISRFEEHSVRSDAEYERYVIRVSGSTVKGIDPMLTSVLTSRHPGFIHAVDLSDELEEFLRPVRDMERESRLSDEYSEYAKMHLFGEFLIRLYRKCGYLYPSSGREEIRLVQRIKSVLETEYGEKLTLDGLSERFGYSVSYLSHIFKRTEGVSVMSYLHGCRISAAKLMLKQGEKSIGETASECGFSDHSDFSRAFRSAVGCTPKEFRERSGK